MNKENHKERQTEEFDKLSDKEKTILAKQLINKTKKILNQTNNFSLTKSYNYNFVVDGAEYKAVYSREINFTGIYFKQIISRNSKIPEAVKARGLAIKIDETFDKFGPSKSFPFVSFHFTDKNQIVFNNNQETIDKINSFLEDFVQKAN